MLAVSFSEARRRFTELVDMAKSGKQILITRHGRPVAVLKRPSKLKITEIAHNKTRP